jgi:hypothetical protein
MDWSVAIGIAAGLGIPGLGGLVLIVRMENRVTTLEQARIAEADWRENVDKKLDEIARDVNQLIGQAGRKPGR